MNLLLDTHTFIWCSGNSSNLSLQARNTIDNEDNSCFVSIASFWEIAIKINIGKLELHMPLEEIFVEVNNSDIKFLSIGQKHILKLRDLSFHHRDPFDRMIIAQAISEDMTIVTKDINFSKYDVKTFW